MYCFFFLFCIQVLEGVIKYRWNALPVEQRDGMKNFISDVIVQVWTTFKEIRNLTFSVFYRSFIIYLIIDFSCVAFWQWCFISIRKAVCQQTQHYISSGKIVALFCYLDWLLGLIYQSHNPLFITYVLSHIFP